MNRVTMMLMAAGLLMPGLAHAYLDPATGSVLVQGLIAAIAAVGVFFDRLRNAVRRILAKRPKDRSAEI